MALTQHFALAAEKIERLEEIEASWSARFDSARVFPIVLDVNVSYGAGPAGLTAQFVEDMGDVGAASPFVQSFAMTPAGLNGWEPVTYDLMVRWTDRAFPISMGFNMTYGDERGLRASFHEDLNTEGVGSFLQSFALEPRGYVGWEALSSSITTRWTENTFPTAVQAQTAYGESEWAFDFFEGLGAGGSAPLVQQMRLTPSNVDGAHAMGLSWQLEWADANVFPIRWVANASCGDSELRMHFAQDMIDGMSDEHDHGRQLSDGHASSISQQFGFTPVNMDGIEAMDVEWVAAWGAQRVFPITATVNASYSESGMTFTFFEDVDADHVVPIVQRMVLTPSNIEGMQPMTNVVLIDMSEFSPEGVRMLNLTMTSAMGDVTAKSRLELRFNPHEASKQQTKDGCLLSAHAQARRCHCAHAEGGEGVGEAGSCAEDSHADVVAACDRHKQRAEARDKQIGAHLGGG